MDQATGDRIAVELGFTPQRVHTLRSLSFEKAVLELEELKKEAKVRYKKLVFKYHPDKNPGDPDASIKLTQLNEVLKTIEGLKVQRTVPPPVMHVQFVNMGPQIYQQVHVRTVPNYQASTTSTTATYVATRVVNVRPV